MARSRHRWRPRLLVERATSSLWLVPSVMVLGAIALSTGLLRLDEVLAESYPGPQWWLFGGNAEGARTLLSVIAGSLITVISVAFSVTMIAIQQASTQYTPRVLRNYTKDRGNQLVLGTYIATFTYALLVLREVRASGPGGNGFVPTWSILGAMILALVSLGALIYFMHHVSESIQVSYVLGVIRAEADDRIEHMFPETLSEEEADPEALSALAERERTARGPEALAVRSGQEGYLRRIDDADLREACEGFEAVVVPVGVGQRLQRDTVIARVWGRAGAGDEAAERLRLAFQVDRDRSMDQDMLYGVRQMVDIAVKALSPGINDPTTAEQALEEIVGAVSLLTHRGMPNPARRLGERTSFLFQVPTFAVIVDESFSQIRRAARAHLHVTMVFLAGLRVLLEHAGEGARREPLRWQVDQVLAGLPGAGFTPADEETVRRAAELVLRPWDGARAGGTPFNQAERV